MDVTSSAFAEGGRIPQPYLSSRAGGEDRSFPLAWSGAPDGTKSFLVAVIDHAPVAHEWMHWCVAQIPPSVTSLPEGASRSSALPAGAREYLNTGGREGYGGPAPPPGSGDHPYEATVYALSVERVDLPEQPSAAEIQRAVAGKVLASGSVTGVYSR